MDIFKNWENMKKNMYQNGITKKCANAQKLGISLIDTKKTL